MNRQPVSSSDICSVGFENGVLEIQFHSGGIYQYNGVSQDTYYGLISASSCGKYFHRYIKPFYRGIKKF